MSRSAFLTTNEIPTTADRRFHHDLILTSRSSETTIPIVKQSSTTNKSMTQMNRRIKRNLRDKRRSTGIRPNDISLASTSTEGSANEDEAENDEEENNSTYIAESHDTFDHNRNLSSLKPMFTVSRIQSSLENVSISRTDPYY
ncbi:hypothetical protein I4U23_002014 [Adineta vaga]|nr:hypothetical protein I4U23_002014 [Adineta vaga]